MTTKIIKKFLVFALIIIFLVFPFIYSQTALSNYDYKDKGTNNKFLNKGGFGYGHLDLQIETMRHLQSIMGSVSNHNTFLIEYNNAKITVRWINIDWIVTQIYHKEIREGNYDLRYEHVYEQLYKFLIYDAKNDMRDNLSFSVDFERINKNKPIKLDKKEFLNSLRMYVRAKRIKPSKIIENKPPSAPDTNEYHSDNLNPNEIRNKHGYSYNVYFSKYEVGQLFIDYEDVVPEFSSLTIEYSLGEDYNRDMFFPLDPTINKTDLKNLIKVRNEILYRLNIEASNNNLFGEDYKEYVYKPYRKVILPQKIKWYTNKQNWKEKQYDFYEKILKYNNVDLNYEHAYDRERLKRLFNKKTEGEVKHEK